ncbi:MAG: phage holin family protein [Fimbriimonadaceae bacterium]|nr:phage holin family protein [Fimbriimonadaceae bacterium]
MSRLLVRWVLFTVAIVIASAITQLLNLGFEARVRNLPDFLTLMIGAAVLAFLNATIGSLLKLLTVPLNCLTFGLFSLIINAVVLLVAAQVWRQLDLGIRVDGFPAALVGSLLITVVNGLFRSIVPAARDDDD